MLVAVLILILVIWRGYLILKERKEEKNHDKNLKVILGYLNADITKSKIHFYLRNNSKQLPVFVDICIDLKKDLKGKSKETIQKLLSADLLQQIYTKKLKTENLGEVSEALVFFRHAETYKDQTEKLLFSMLTHKNVEIAFAAALVLIKTEKYDIKSKVLKMMSNRKDITPISFLELLIGIEEADKMMDEQEESIFMKLIKDDQTPIKNKIILVKFIGNAKLFNAAPQLFRLLSSYLKGENYEEKDRMISALIEALGELQYEKILKCIETLINISNTVIKVGCVKALGSLTERKSIDLLHIFFNNSDEDVQFEAMRQLLRLGEPVLSFYRNKIILSAIERNTLQELREIKSQHYG